MSALSKQDLEDRIKNLEKKRNEILDTFRLPAHLLEGGLLDNYYYFGSLIKHLERMKRDK